MSNIILPMQRSRPSAVRTVRTQFQLEWLESRRLLSTYTVTNTNDNTSSGSLRWAITNVTMTRLPTPSISHYPERGLNRSC